VNGVSRSIPTTVILFALNVFAIGHAAELSGAALARALQHGGYVLVMRHASAPTAPPSAAEADPGNPDRQRQLDGAGKAAATAMGNAIRKLNMRVGRVWSSPTYRALETARLAGLPPPKTAPELGDRGRSMSAATGEQSAWLRTKTGERPRSGTDSILITHQPNIAAAFGQDAQGLGDGEALVFKPTADGESTLVARIPMADWPRLAGG
jgi:phosphohistidine phosphatase SixA